MAASERIQSGCHNNDAMISASLAAKKENHYVGCKRENPIEGNDVRRLFGGVHTHKQWVDTALTIQVSSHPDYSTIRPVARKGQGANCFSITQLVGQKR